MRSPVRIGAVVAVAVAGGLGAWAIVGNEDSGPSSALTDVCDDGQVDNGAKPIAPVGLSAKGLRTLGDRQSADLLGWPEARVSLRAHEDEQRERLHPYLPPGAEVGSKQAIYLIIATYPYRGALQALKGLPSQPKLTIPGGGIAVVDRKDPKSVHLAYPGINDQVEEYDPSPARSLGGREVRHRAARSTPRLTTARRRLSTLDYTRDALCGLLRQ